MKERTGKARTIYASEQDWAVWRAEAARIGGVIGRPMPVSEMIRNAVSQFISERAETSQASVSQQQWLKRDLGNV